MPAFRSTLLPVCGYSKTALLLASRAVLSCGRGLGWGGVQRFFRRVILATRSLARRFRSMNSSSERN